MGWYFCLFVFCFFVYFSVHPSGEPVHIPRQPGATGGLKAIALTRPVPRPNARPPDFNARLTFDGKWGVGCCLAVVAAQSSVLWVFLDETYSAIAYIAI